MCILHQSSPTEGPLHIKVGRYVAPSIYNNVAQSTRCGIYLIRDLVMEVQRSCIDFYLHHNIAQKHKPQDAKKGKGGQTMCPHFLSHPFISLL